jgi:hypothetical protein
MKTIQSILMLAVLLYAGAGAAAPEIATAGKPRPAFASLSPAHQTLLTTWLNQDCRVDSGEIERDMVSAAAILEGPLWEAFELGPPAEARTDMQNSLAERYALRLRWLMQNGLEAVDSRLRTQLLEESEEQFRAGETEKLARRWSDAAVAGLGLLCTDRTLGMLRLIARDERHPSSIAAGAALQTSGNCRAR